MFTYRPNLPKQLDIGYYFWQSGDKCISLVRFSYYRLVTYLEYWIFLGISGETILHKGYLFSDFGDLIQVFGDE